MTTPTQADALQWLDELRKSASGFNKTMKNAEAWEAHNIVRAYIEGQADKIIIDRADVPSALKDSFIIKFGSFKEAERQANLIDNGCLGIWSIIKAGIVLAKAKGE